MRLFLHIPVIWAALLIAQSLGGGLPDLFSNLTAALEHPFQIQWTDKSLLTILICTGVYITGLCIYDAESGRTRDGEEHGSAAWGSPRQLNAQFRQKQNKILTRHVRLGLDTHKHRRSLNVLVIGGSGAAKTRGYVKPNILEANSNYVITDPKMEVLTATGGYLKQQGYDIRVLNLVDLSQSDGYNPFRYLRDEKDALKLVNTLIQATTPKGSHESDPFWSKSETALLQAIILMLFQEAPEYEQNFSMVMRVLEYAEVKEDDDEYVSPLDLLFRAMEYENPESVALRQYKVFKQAAGKTAKSILVSAAVRLAPFNLPQIKAVTDHDDMDIYTLGERKCALYAVIPDNDTTFTFLVSLLYSQIFQTLYYCADQIHHGALPCHVHFILDEAPSVNLPGLPRELATMRSRNISCSTIIQNMAQIKELYKDSWETIPGNSDTLLYLGGNEASTHKYISEALGKSTIDTKTHGQTKGRSGSYSTNFQMSGRELLGLKAGAPADDVSAKIMELKSGNIDGVNVLAELKELKRKNAERDAVDAVELALKGGKITPAQKGWAKEYALDNPEGFKSFVEKAPQIVPLSEVAGDSVALKSDKIDDATLLVCKQLGLSAEDVEKYGKE